MPLLTEVRLPEGTALHRVYTATWGYDEHNPGYGDARFSPIPSTTGPPVPSMYLAATETAALLETVFHEVHQSSARFIYARDLRDQLLAYLRTPAPAILGDLRDPELLRLGMRREEVVSSAAEHYPCTRRLAVTAHDQQPELQGLLWHSRQAELAQAEPTEVLVLFGDRYPAGRGTWPVDKPGVRGLSDGPGRLLVDRLAEELGATVQPEE